MNKGASGCARISKPARASSSLIQCPHSSGLVSYLSKKVNKLLL